jgi:hypothetical protein
MTLNPARYECPHHHTDLTGLVKEALEDQGSPVAYRRPWLGRQGAGDRPFQVIVACPGDGAAHSLTCTGTQVP